MLFGLAGDVSEQRDLAAQQPGRIASQRMLYADRSAEIAAARRNLGPEPKPSESVPAKKATPE